MDVDYTSLEVLDSIPSTGYSLDTCTQSLHAKAVTFFERASRFTSGLGGHVILFGLSTLTNMFHFQMFRIYTLSVSLIATFVSPSIEK